MPLLCLWVGWLLFGFVFVLLAFMVWRLLAVWLGLADLWWVGTCCWVFDCWLGVLLAW